VCRASGSGGDNNNNNNNNNNNSGNTNNGDNNNNADNSNNGDNNNNDSTAPAPTSSKESIETSSAKVEEPTTSAPPEEVPTPTPQVAKATETVVPQPTSTVRAPGTTRDDPINVVQPTTSSRAAAAISATNIPNVPQPISGTHRMIPRGLTCGTFLGTLIVTTLLM